MQHVEQAVRAISFATSTEPSVQATVLEAPHDNLKTLDVSDNVPRRFQLMQTFLDIFRCGRRSLDEVDITPDDFQLLDSSSHHKARLASSTPSIPSMHPQPSDPSSPSVTAADVRSYAESAASSSGVATSSNSLPLVKPPEPGRKALKTPSAILRASLGPRLACSRSMQLLLSSSSMSSRGRGARPGIAHTLSITPRSGSVSPHSPTTPPYSVTARHGSMDMPGRRLGRPATFNSGTGLANRLSLGTEVGERQRSRLAMQQTDAPGGRSASKSDTLQRIPWQEAAAAAAAEPIATHASQPAVSADHDPPRYPQPGASEEDSAGDTELQPRVSSARGSRSLVKRDSGSGSGSGPGLVGCMRLSRNRTRIASMPCIPDLDLDPAGAPGGAPRGGQPANWLSEDGGVHHGQAPAAAAAACAAAAAHPAPAPLPPVHRALPPVQHQEELTS